MIFNYLAIEKATVLIWACDETLKMMRCMLLAAMSSSQSITWQKFPRTYSEGFE